MANFGSGLVGAGATARGQRPAASYMASFFGNLLRCFQSRVIADVRLHKASVENIHDK